MEYDLPLMDVYDSIVIHHTSPAISQSTPYQIQLAEMSDGFYDIGYHFMIGPDGVIYEGRTIQVRGMHVGIGVDPISGEERGNTGRIGIAMIGDFTLEHPTPAQEKALAELIIYLDIKYDISYLYGHSDLNNTECPGANAYYLIDKYKDLTK